jgi:hypothetical protein
MRFRTPLPESWLAWQLSDRQQRSVPVSQLKNVDAKHNLWQRTPVMAAIKPIRET